MIYIFQEAFKGFFKNKSMSLITIGIISVSIFIFGLFIIGTANLMNLIKLAEDKIEMVAYINENTNTFEFSKSKPITYIHGYYYSIGKRLGRFGFSVKKNKYKRDIDNNKK